MSYVIAHPLLRKGKRSESVLLQHPQTSGRPNGALAFAAEIAEHVLNDLIASFEFLGRPRSSGGDSRGECAQPLPTSCRPDVSSRRTEPPARRRSSGRASRSKTSRRRHAHRNQLLHYHKWTLKVEARTVVLQNEIRKAERELGHSAFSLIESGDIAHPELETAAARLREARQALKDKEAEIARLRHGAEAGDEAAPAPADEAAGAGAA